METNKTYNENCLETMKRMPDNFIDCVVTSPPYWGLRDYGHKDQIGLEATPEEYVSKMVEIFREVRRVLKPEGTLWLNLGDSYCGYKGENYMKNPDTSKLQSKSTVPASHMIGTPQTSGLKPKDLVGIPWRVALALQADGWWLRQDIIWAKPNPMPESVTDRCTKAHEYIFLLTKSDRYFYDAEAIAEKTSTIRGPRPFGGAGNGKQNKDRGDYFYNGDNGKRNKRSIWEITTQPFPESHFATFPIDLPSLCILAGCPKRCCPICGNGWTKTIEQKVSGVPQYNEKTVGQFHHHSNSHTLRAKERTTRILDFDPNCDCGEEKGTPGIVYDPFMGAATTALAALKYGRQFIGSEINPEYCEIGNKRIAPYLQQMSLAI